MVAMHQDAKFQGVNQEFHAFQSVLGEVVEDLAACSDNKQSKFKRIFIKRIFFCADETTKGADASQILKEIRHQISLFQIDACCL